MNECVECVRLEGRGHMGQAQKWLSSPGPSVNVDNVCSVSVDELLTSVYAN